MTTDGSDMTIKMELPGVAPDDVDVELTGNVLTIAGERKDVVDSDNGRALVREMHYGSFRRSFRLPDGVDPDQITDSFDHGMLIVRVKDVVPGRLPRKIAVQLRGTSPNRAPKQIEGETVEPAETPQRGQQTPADTA
jgi:HSP20 family protein